MAQWFDGENKNPPYFALAYEKKYRPPPIIREKVNQVERTVNPDDLVQINNTNVDANANALTRPRNVAVNGVQRLQASASGDLVTEFVLYRNRTATIFGPGAQYRIQTITSSIAHPELNFDMYRRPHILTSRPIAGAPDCYNGVIGIWGAPRDGVEWQAVDFTQGEFPAIGIFDVRIANPPRNSATPEEMNRARQDRAAGRGAIAPFQKNFIARVDPKMFENTTLEPGKRLNNHHGDFGQRVCFVDGSQIDDRQKFPIRRDGTVVLIIRYRAVPNSQVRADGSVVIDTGTRPGALGQTITYHTTRRL